MKKRYQQPLAAERRILLKVTFLDHFVSTPGGEEEEFNAKQRMDFEHEVQDEDDPWPTTQHSLW